MMPNTLFYPKIILASNHQGKIKELQKLFQPYHIQIIPQSELNIPEAKEPYLTFIENALNKARQASHMSGLPAIADDSGICAAALGNQPGVLSARFAGQEKSDLLNNQKMTESLKPYSNKTIFYYCCLILITHAKDPTPVIAEGKWFGQWIDEARGTNGFGYDPHFFLPEQSLTVAELNLETKNQQSHRAKAFQNLIRQLSLSNL